ncbi:PAS domain S-box protein [Methanoregula sp.]|uniref:hybrid sensor histidine kinase/response regulator n=1 Tax=Methanoregula sp. TaxID=2052170 RepID=UPI00260A7893|nr:PAS domain S-box protein [Methanoregula sp.]MDD5143616.1 PAS domain S-box protein [Methanoregula sp.]
MEVQDAQRTLVPDSRNSISLLYVDDDPTLLEICKLFLEHSGRFHVDTLSFAPEALERLTSFSYDAIISDYQMPVMDGIAFLKMLRSLGNSTPFILFTGKGREEIVIEALNNGADFYLQKGGEPEAQFAELEHKIRMIVEQRKIKNELIESQRRVSDIIDFLPDATFAIDLAGMVIAWNRAMEEMTGVKKGEILGTGNHSYSIPLYQERHPLLLDLVLADDKITEEKYPWIRRKDHKLISEIFIPTLYEGKGAFLWFTASPFYDMKNNVVGAIESIRDVTDQRKADEALAQSERRYRNVVEDQSEFISRFLPDGTHVFVNGAYCRYFNREPDSILGKRFIPRIPQEDLVLLKKHLTSLTQEKPVAVIEHRTIIPPGEIRWQRWTDRAIFDTKGTIAEYQSVGRDITEQKKLEESLWQTNKKLNLLNNITCHDILNQLTVLLAYLEFAKEKTSGSEALDFLKKGILAVNKIQTLIRFTRYYQDLGIVMPEWQNLRNVCMRAIPTGRDGITVAYPSGDLEIYADQLLEKVLCNLFDTAVGHMKQMSEISITFCENPEPGGVTVIVEDNGTGIPDNVKERIFGRGYETNTGFGLFLAREILLITGITIRETGIWGEGARFEIQIPPGGFRFVPPV